MLMLMRLSDPAYARLLYVNMHRSFMEDTIAFSKSHVPCE